MVHLGQIPENVRKIWAKLDERDRKIVNLLNKNSRLTLKELGREVGLSIDSVKARIDKMREFGVIDRFTVIPNPKAFGLPLGVHIYIKLQNITDEKIKELKNYFQAHHRVIVSMAVLGDYDMYFVMLARDTPEMNHLKNEIRKKFFDIIADWREVVVAEIYKYEEYQF
jgi:DNA-binding Lrp family transcriptional regulator